jgi:predicted amino acid racemase
MSAPRLEVRLDRIGHNAGALVARLAPLGISVTGITKATLGCPEVARVLLAAGVTGLGESRIEGIEALRRAGVDAHLVLIRSPMLSQVDRVVEHASASLNTELAVIQALGAAAVARAVTHKVILMVELGDLREGILPDDVEAILDGCLALDGIEVQGLGTNLACQSGSTPDQRSMDELGALATALETHFDIDLPVVSGGNSANLDWALGGRPLGGDPRCVDRRADAARSVG